MLEKLKVLVSRPLQYPLVSSGKSLVSFLSKKSHSAKKCKIGDPSGFINIHSVAKYQKTLWRQKNFRKQSHKKQSQNFRKQSDRKNQKGGPLGTSGCVCFLEKVTTERGTLWTTFASLPGPDLALVGFSIVSKKWTD